MQTYIRGLQIVWSFDYITILSTALLLFVVIVVVRGRCPPPDDIAPCQCRTRGPSIQVRCVNHNNNNSNNDNNNNNNTNRGGHRISARELGGGGRDF